MYGFIIPRLIVYTVSQKRNLVRILNMLIYILSMLVCILEYVYIHG